MAPNSKWRSDSRWRLEVRSLIVISHKNRADGLEYCKDHVSNQVIHLSPKKNNKKSVLNLQYF